MKMNKDRAEIYTYASEAPLYAMNWSVSAAEKGCVRFNALKLQQWNSPGLRHPAMCMGVCTGAGPERVLGCSFSPLATQCHHPTLLEAQQGYI